MRLSEFAIVEFLRCLTSMHVTMSIQPSTSVSASSYFAKTWQLMGPVSQLGQRGDYCAAEIAGHKVFAVRGRDGTLRAFRNLCRHRGARLLPEGNGRCPTIRCPYHQWVWADDGRLLAVPWFGEDPDFKLEDWRLEEIHLREWRGLLFIAIDPSISLEEQLGDLIAELRDEPIETYQAVQRRAADIRCELEDLHGQFRRGLSYTRHPSELLRRDRFRAVQDHRP